MLTPRQIKGKERLLAVIRAASKTFPELRFGQMIENALGPLSVNFYYMEDDALAEKIAAYCKAHAPHQASHRRW